MGFVYVIHAIGTNRYKIGKSIRERQYRLRELRKQSPYPISLVLWLPTDNPIKLEDALHKAFEWFRVHGEWFEFFDDDMALILEIIEEIYGKPLPEPQMKIGETRSNRPLLMVDEVSVFYFFANFLFDRDGIIYMIGLGNDGELVEEFSLLKLFKSESEAWDYYHNCDGVYVRLDLHTLRYEMRCHD